MLRGLNNNLRFRILRGDERAWAEVARSAEGQDLPDIAAGALSRGLPIPSKMAEELLEYCFQADLPLLALKVLTRIDGKRFLMLALERASTHAWQRVAERIVEQVKPGQRHWLNPPALRYAIHEVQSGRSQYRLVLSSFLSCLRANEDQDFLEDPCVLARGGAECPICLEPLCRSTPTAFVAAEGAVCLHFLCSNCARGYAASTSSQGEPLRCPECRRHAAAMRALPPLSEDPLHWFQFVAGADCESTVARPMLLRTLSAMLPLEADAIEEVVEGLASLGQEVNAAEFLTHPLFVWLWQHLQEHFRCSKLPPAPDLEERRAWFRHWNLSQSGRLSRSEVLRAVLRSFRLTSLDKQKVSEMRTRIDHMWDAWTAQRPCGMELSPTCEEFAAEGGFGDLLEETFGAEGNDLHPSLWKDSQAPKFRVRGRNPGVHRLQSRAAPRTRTPSAPSAPPPDLEVPSEMPAPSAPAPAAPAAPAVQHAVRMDLFLPQELMAYRANDADSSAFGFTHSARDLSSESSEEESSSTSTMDTLDALDYQLEMELQAANLPPMVDQLPLPRPPRRMELEAGLHCPDDTVFSL